MLNGETVLDSQDEPVLVGRIIAEAIRRGNSLNERGQPAYDAMRAEKLAWKIYDNDGDAIDLDDADVSMITHIIEKDALLNNMSKAACLGILQETPPE
jgi:hypothetical protein